ncbi:MAG TPA: metallophosphoesterase [Gemmataceae bacterium]|nr:metallophosphoesterase [Gemmataceae bacterium]
MKPILLSAVAVAALVTAVAVSQPGPKPGDAATADLKIQTESRNPWTNLKLNNSSEDFQFVVVSDRTGGHREKIFSKAVEQINLLQPEFVLSVGDLIEGYTTDREKVLDQWKEFQSFTSKLQMPFFYVPGNHDVTNPEMEKIWEEKFGRRYYHFVYKNVLFLVLNSDDPAGSAGMSEEQVAWAGKVLDENRDVKWTIVAFHRPLWDGADIEKNRWGQVEKALMGRNYTVFVGHEHRYVRYVRNGMNYYQLATTGGGSRLRGVKYGEFDHITWVTMKKGGPVLANVMLDGVLPENLTLPETDEPVAQYDRKPTHPTRGYAYLDGAPAAGATVTFVQPAPNKKGFRFVADALVEGDGSFAVSTYGAFDGLPVGEYTVVAAFDGRYGYGLEKKGQIPAVYARPETSPVRATIKAGKNELTIELRTAAGEKGPEPKPVPPPGPK